MTETFRAAGERASDRPRLLFFHSTRSGQCRRVEGYLAQVLQRRRNHETFTLVPVASEQHPELVERFQIIRLPTLLVLERRRVRARLETPRGCNEVNRFLAPWLH